MKMLLNRLGTFGAPVLFWAEKAWSVAILFWAALYICAAGMWDGLTGNAGEDETDEEWELLSAAWSRGLKGGKTDV